MAELGTLSPVGEELLVSILQLIPPSSLALVTRSCRALRTVGNNEAVWSGHVPAGWLSAGVSTSKGEEHGPREWDKVSDPLLQPAQRSQGNS